MLKKTKSNEVRRKRKVDGRVSIVASRYNGTYVDAMLRSAKQELKEAGISRIEVVRVPGAFEVPVVAAKWALNLTDPPDAVICLGVIFQGETAHARQIGDSVSFALAELQIRSLVPIIHGVYLFDNREQAVVRCLGKDHNRGVETARTAVEMVRVLRRI